VSTFIPRKVRQVNGPSNLFGSDAVDFATRIKLSWLWELKEIPMFCNTYCAAPATVEKIFGAEHR